MKRSRLDAFIQAIRATRSVLDDDTALVVKDIYPDWRENTPYTMGYRVLDDGVLYKCLQNHTSQASWRPADAVSLWARVLIPDPEVIPDWVQPDSTNPYMIGDKVKHSGKTWESDVDNNVWEPGVYGWSEVVV